MNSIVPIVLRFILAVVLVTVGLPALGSGGPDSNRASSASGDTQVEPAPGPRAEGSSTDSAAVKAGVDDVGTARDGEDCMDHGADSETPSSASECMTGSGDCCAGGCAQSCTTLAMVAVTPGSEITSPTARRRIPSSAVPASRTPETLLRPPQL